MARSVFDEKDRQQIRAHGLTEEEVARQLRIFETGAPYADIDRPCTAGDGIRRLSHGEMEGYADFYGQAGRRRHLTKFVPASGAATRMFKALLKISNDHDRVERQAIEARAAEKGNEYAEVLAFIDHIEKFAFYGVLAEKMAADGHDIENLRKSGDFTLILSYLLTGKGLNYAGRPKGQILFHRYPDAPRTAFEEHLVEAAEYAADAEGRCRLHFTVSPEHESGFRSIMEKAAPRYAKKYNVDFDCRFSRQHPGTDTIAVDIENRPFRDKKGNLVFRPGGHGALVANLNGLEGDIVFIKNIDNVVPDTLKPETVLWKKVLAGMLLTIEQEIGRKREILRNAGCGEKEIAAVRRFVETELSVALPERIAGGSREDVRRFLADRLDRPLRVCGMVPSAGEPGGGPFWVKSADGSLSVQIVESAQIDPESATGQQMLKRLTHFNPVDIVCRLRNDKGEPYDLARFVDATAVFISQKSKDGRDLKALEHPGLWNGAMAGWNTVFVEVPLITFNPVKTVNDLLRETHQG